MNPGLHTDSSASILITVVAITNTFALYLNHQKIGVVTDNIGSKGKVSKGNVAIEVFSRSENTSIATFPLLMLIYTALKATA